MIWFTQYMDHKIFHNYVRDEILVKKKVGSTSVTVVLSYVLSP